MENKTNLEINKHYKFDWCIIRHNNTVECYDKDDESHYASWLSDKDHMVNTEIWIDEIGLLHIESPNKIIGEISFNKTRVDELEHTPCKRCIQYYKGIKWLGIKPYYYVYGWWYYKSDIAVNYILSDYTLKIK